LDAIEIYKVIRSEIITNHVLMHWISLIVILALLVGTIVVEKTRPTILSVFLPLLSLAWSAAIVRFDFFIHRQAAYLRSLEGQMREGGLAFPLWETWKASLRATPFVIPVADTITFAVIIIPTAYLLLGPAREYFQLRQWRGQKVYAWGVIAVIILLLCFLAVIPQIADRRY
jgi:hypothetical protein